MFGSLWNAVAAHKHRRQDGSEHARLNPSQQAGTRFTYPTGMEG